MYIMELLDSEVVSLNCYQIGLSNKINLSGATKVKIASDFLFLRIFS
jgi:hypothetical protein